MRNNSRPATIMMVTGGSAGLNFLGNILSEQGNTVCIFPGGKQALQSAEQNPPDLILLDANMPELDGYEVCITLKSHPVLKNIPIIFTSAMVDAIGKVKGVECGDPDYMSRPFEPWEVKARIKTHLALSDTELLKREIRQRIRIEEQYYAQLDNLSHAIIHVNQKGTIVYCNPVVEKYFAYAKSELIGQTIEVLISPEQQNSHIRHRGKYIQEPTTRQMSGVKNVHARRKNGETFPVDISLSTLYSEEGLLFSAEIRDITEQLRLTKELAQQRRFLEDAFSKTTDGIVVTDANGMILVTNPALTNMLGYLPDELAGKQAEFLYDAAQHNKGASLRNAAGDEVETKSCVINFRRKDTSSFPAEVLVIPVKDELGACNGHFFIIHDISKRLLMEQKHKSLVKQLVQAQKMEALGQLTGGIAHDFNNILASMIGFTELTIELLKGEPVLDNKETRERVFDYMDEIYASGKRAQDLIAQMLTFSRTDHNSSLQTLDLGMLLNEAIKMLRPVLPASILIKAHIQNHIPPVMADPVQVHQLLMNICINARDAMDGKGQIDITLAETAISSRLCTACQQAVAGKYLELAVRDTGPGIEEKLVVRLFEPFFTTKKVGKGTGMGLAMAHGIIHHHSGHIIVESEPGRGSTFRLLFPLLPAEIEQAMHNPDVPVKIPETA